jgi:hypothetical protein
MTSTELASYVLLLSLPLWLLVEQLIHLRTGYRKGRRAPPDGPLNRSRHPPCPRLCAPAKNDMVWPSPRRRDHGAAAAELPASSRLRRRQEERRNGPEL